MNTDWRSWPILTWNCCIIYTLSHFITNEAHLKRSWAQLWISSSTAAVWSICASAIWEQINKLSHHSIIIHLNMQPCRNQLASVGGDRGAILRVCLLLKDNKMRFQFVPIIQILSVPEGALNSKSRAQHFLRGSFCCHSCFFFFPKSIPVIMKL